MHFTKYRLALALPRQADSTSFRPIYNLRRRQGFSEATRSRFPLVTVPWSEIYGEKA